MEDYVILDIVLSEIFQEFHITRALVQ